jgi:hypothetical protein
MNKKYTHIEKYPEGYNVRNEPKQRALPEEKQNAFTALCTLFQDHNKKYRRLMSMKNRLIK